MQELAGILEVQTTNFSVQKKITTNEWVFAQEIYPIENFTLHQTNHPIYQTYCL